MKNLHPGIKHSKESIAGPYLYKEKYWLLVSG
jgi:hypothetical protein